MTPTLRRAHRVTWLVLTIVLPIGFVAGWRLSTGPPVQETPVGSPLAAPLPILVRSVAKPGLQVSLRRGSQSVNRQLEIVLRQPLEVPSVVVRVITKTNERAVGTLGVAGVYRFALPDSTNHPTITLADDIHHTVLQTIHF